MPIGADGSKLLSRQVGGVGRVGRTGVVTKRIAPRECGLVKVGAEEWRAELASEADAAREIGVVVTVASVDGVTLRVR